MRTQVYLEPEQHQWLRKEARGLNVPMTELLRRIIDDHLHTQRQSPPPEAFMSIVNLGESEVEDVSESHDRYLAEVLASEHLC